MAKALKARTNSPDRRVYQCPLVPKSELMTWTLVCVCVCMVLQFVALGIIIRDNAKIQGTLEVNRRIATVALERNGVDKKRLDQLEQDLGDARERLDGLAAKTH